MNANAAHTDALTLEEKILARSQGWDLFHVFDLKSAHWRVQALSTSEMPSATATLQLLINQAKTGSVLHQKALRLIMASNQAG